MSVHARLGVCLDDEHPHEGGPQAGDPRRSPGRVRDLKDNLTTHGRTFDLPTVAYEHLGIRCAATPR